MKQKHIQHLYWRASFGIDVKQFESLKSTSKKKIVSKLITDSKEFKNLELDLSEFDSIKYKSYKELKDKFTEEELQKLTNKRNRKVRDLNYAWIYRLSEPKSLLREKMTLFWANVFVCRDNDVFFIQDYNNTLRKYALGDFRVFVKQIAKQPSMLKYLNNKQNKKRKPNENFARELMELFTLGVGNYTEQDIQESARAFTGWTHKKNGDFYLQKSQHDFDEKTFFGKTGNFDGDDIIDIILEQKQCARFICDKIYRYFINPKVDKKRLEEITNIFYKDYNISNLMEHIFTSKWFYNDENIGVKIKSPIELLVGIQKVVPVTFDKKQQLNYLQKMMGQTLLYPDNVAGWKGGKSWIDSNTLMFRMKLPSLLLSNAIINLEEKGEFEDSFEKYYKGEKQRNKYLKITKNWEFFDKQNQNLSSKELIDLLILSKLDKDTATFLENLEIKSNRNFCVQLMSIPEYQLC
ncbi:DUF1800 family protein [Polaribacter sp. Hel_I_88]|uniref:DUF1800 domain-containing protein n=1 Tax=Polaribacter sp. Hel_I_88 TaxID=1250006 RepID=UPI0004797B1B|nr:DUF1800 domain-containing protein [Polaribacter sp. Hel_I_88]